MSLHTMLWFLLGTTCTATQEQTASSLATSTRSTSTRSRRKKQSMWIGSYVMCDVVWCHAMLCDVILCCIMFCFVMLYVMSCYAGHVMLNHVTSYYATCVSSCMLVYANLPAVVSRPPPNFDDIDPERATKYVYGELLDTIVDGFFVLCCVLCCLLRVYVVC